MLSTYAFFILNQTMTHIFISYSSTNRSFALQLVENLERFFKVWIDREGLDGGEAWEQAIDAALKDCAVFVVIVSPQSNESQWVRRETIRAEQLKKVRIPILIEGELPLRLLDIQFVDFRGDYDGGLRDLMEVLQDHMSPEQKNQNEIDRLIGAGIRAYLKGDISSANNLIGQAALIGNDIADKLNNFWQQLMENREADLSTDLMGKISILEKAKQAGKFANGNTRFEWSVEVVAPDDALDQIDHVKYELHESFAVPTQIVRDRQSHFRLSASGWGTFDMQIGIHFKDGTVGSTHHDLTFESAF
jgi:TIR domain-containing protein/pYEATS domain-containing protein involved in immunity